MDRYVAGLFALSYATAFFLVVGLYVVVDLSINLDEYLQEHGDGTTPGMGLVARYYALHLPFLYLEMSPFVTLVAALFTGARMVRNNELVAALGAGISSRRLFAPLVVAALGLALGMFALREWATDTVSRERDQLREYLLEQNSELVYENLWVRDLDRQQLRVGAYRPRAPGGPEFSELLARFTSAEDTVAIDARRAHSPRRVDGRWVWELEEGQRIRFDRDERHAEALDRFDLVNVGPADIELAWRGREHPLDLSFAQAGELLIRDPDNLQYRTVRQYHLTFPFAGLVLLLVGLPFLIGQERGRGVERVALGVLLCMAYFAVDFVTRTLGLQGSLAPVYAAWFPLVLFGSLGLVLFGSMRS